MDSDLVAHSNHLADRRGSHDETTLRDRSSKFGSAAANEACLTDAGAGTVARSMDGSLGGHWLVCVGSVGVTPVFAFFALTLISLSWMLQNAFCRSQSRVKSRAK
jgi:hypothetical protein